MEGPRKTFAPAAAQTIAGSAVMAAALLIALFSGIAWAAEPETDRQLESESRHDGDFEADVDRERSATTAVARRPATAVTRA